ncbi:hypothetical protein SV7mr_19170 [Stieleria bergensis]|uniref:Uncharacterized protein n=1 Tax=Stieleria bergensis TaxID=2528025 RepID=A0A517STG3_9BACT|nr:hypothetical protein SV7mr_19170 [Planctomycetes bacterium SV_7m_r]
MRLYTNFHENSLQTLSMHANVCGRWTPKRPRRFQPVISSILLLATDVADVKWLSLTTRGYLSHIYPYKDLLGQTYATFTTSAQGQLDPVEFDWLATHQSGAPSSCAFGGDGCNGSNQPVDKARAASTVIPLPKQWRKSRHLPGSWASIAPMQVSGRFRANHGPYRRKCRLYGHTERPPCYSEFVLVRGAQSHTQRGPPETTEKSFSWRHAARIEAISF